jgi:hypothetical protein
VLLAAQLKVLHDPDTITNACGFSVFLPWGGLPRYVLSGLEHADY